MKQLLLVRHGATSATERGAFGTDEPLTDAARARAGKLGAVLPAAADVICSPKRRCRETASAAGLHPAIEPALTECGFGSWEGLTFAEAQAADPLLISGWLADPAAAPPGGESLEALTVRIAAWLERIASASGTLVAITHAGVIKAAVVRALRAPVDVFWRLEIDPLSITELRAHDGEWTLRRLNWSIG